MDLFTRRAQTAGPCRLNNCNNSERSSSSNQTSKASRKFNRTSEAPYQLTGRRTLSAALGYKELYTSPFWLSLLSECLSCCLYVFIVCSTRISWTGAIIGHEPNLIAMSLSSGITMMLLIFTFRSVHVNPALTISFLLTGRIPILRALLYLLVQCFGSVAAIAFLYFISLKGHAGALGLDNPHAALSDVQILTIEFVISFIVTLTTFATCNFSSYKNAKKSILENEVLNFDTKGITYPEDDYNYDNHRIYATQQLNSESSLEEAMQEESNFLAPNGFSLHVTTGQAFVIGLAYTLTSLTGIPASGASLNPARSFGPAFIMNRWDRQWIYWVGPIVGAVTAAFFYEFIFNPTRKSSLCYRPKLFRLSAHDMAKVGSKSRLYQQYQQKLSFPTTQPLAGSYRQQQAYNRQLYHSPTSEPNHNLISSSSLLKSSLRDPKPLSNSTLVTHLQTPSYPLDSNTFNQMSYMYQQQQQQQQQQQHQQQNDQDQEQPQQFHQHLHPSNFDMSKSTVLINSMTTTAAAKQHQTLANPLQRNKLDLALNLDHKRPALAASAPNGANSSSALTDHNQLLYDDPTFGSSSANNHQYTNTRRQPLGVAPGSQLANWASTTPSYPDERLYYETHSPQIT